MRSSLSDSNQETKQDTVPIQAARIQHRGRGHLKPGPRQVSGRGWKADGREEFSSGKRGSVRGRVGVKKRTQRAALECWQLPHSSPQRAGSSAMVLSPYSPSPSGLPKYRCFPSLTSEKCQTAHNTRLVGWTFQLPDSHVAT